MDKWDKTFVASLEMLEQWADEALADYREGRALPMKCEVCGYINTWEHAYCFNCGAINGENNGK